MFIRAALELIARGFACMHECVSACVCVCVFLLCVVSSDVNRHCVGGGTVSKLTVYRLGQRYIRWLLMKMLIMRD